MITSIVTEAEAILVPLGWKEMDRNSALVDPHGDRCVVFYPGHGYTWELRRFDDSDHEGVATARWVSMGIEGDMLADLMDELRKLNYPGIPDGSQEVAR
jgi:hypothetical protein